ncbi:MAG: hypothetical protein A2133_10295 [Actinobacteria bacterium RBG_16_64_13]|nr:MAG: hypothetical protein A2133_10295 [Actinobacteria bacterium RBG_16_64_13]
MLELERNSPIEAETLREFFTRCGWQASEATAKLEWALAASDEWVVCKLDGQLVGFGRSCRLDAVNRVVFDALVDPRFNESGLRGEIVRLLTENAGRLEKVSVYSERQAGLLFPPPAQEEPQPVRFQTASSRIYLGRQRTPSGDDE